ncbi:hypothetical protein HPB51_016461 [Rhipicephalus microplus]|uniref:Flavin-containing monooxygenase n=1 Tax=Rhipicephalus microplus TaxID=6941 RepID=A0A9J6DVV0_RHIMP|nr:hypothetical protein HPB51_016461 [Rhipicephalus microplus]
MSKKKVCVVGAGSSGLTCARQMLDYGFDVVLYERSADTGGLWAYHEDDVEGQASVMRTTIINTSKEMSAFSDFPPPKDLPNYMHNTKMLGYFRSYADHFGVTNHVKTKHDVVQATAAADYEKTGRWDVLVRDLETNTDRTETFDAVAVCVGHHVYPNVPHFKGQEKFRGRVVHTHSLKNADSFRNHRVAVVGIGNSAVDAVVDVSYVAVEATVLDDVILATGYQIKFPFLPKDVVSVVDNQVQLYKYVFPPHLTASNFGVNRPYPAGRCHIPHRRVAEPLAGRAAGQQTFAALGEGHFRLEGPHSWSGARQAILDSRHRIMYPLNDRCTSFSKKKKGPSAFRYMFFFFFTLAVAYVFSGQRQLS